MWSMINTTLEQTGQQNWGCNIWNEHIGTILKHASLPTEHKMKNENFDEWGLCLEIAQLRVITNCVWENRWKMVSKLSHRQNFPYFFSIFIRQWPPFSTLYFWSTSKITSNILITVLMQMPHFNITIKYF